MERKWSMRGYKEGDEEGILELTKAVNPSRQYDRGQWLRWGRWMYRANPAGPGRIGLAEHNGKIVGQYAIVPTVMKVSTEVIIGSQSLDTMTHPNYRRRGLFEILAKQVYREAGSDGIHIVYGFPNEFSHPGFIRKLNWFDISTTRIMVKPINWGNVIRMRIDNKFLSHIGGIGGSLASKVFCRVKRVPLMDDLAIRQVSSFDERINELWTKVSTQHHIMVVRNRDYLNWRYVAIPDVDYQIYIAERGEKICGYLVLRYMQRDCAKVGTIFDVLALSGQITRCLLLKVIDDCQQEKPDLIACSLIANKTYLNAFRKSGFISLPFLRGGRFCAYSSAPNISKDFLEDSPNWFIQIGDSDAI